MKSNKKPRKKGKREKEGKRKGSRIRNREKGKKGKRRKRRREKEEGVRRKRKKNIFHNTPFPAKNSGRFKGIGIRLQREWE